MKVTNAALWLSAAFFVRRTSHKILPGVSHNIHMKPL